MTTAMSAEAKHLEKMIAKEAKADEQNLSHVLSDLKHADKAAARAEKSVDKALHHVDKAVSHEHKAATKLSSAEHKHNVMLQEVTQAQKDVELKKRQQADLASDLARKRASVDEYQRRKEFNDQERERKLAELHMQAAQSAVPSEHSRAGTMSSVGTAGTADTHYTANTHHSASPTDTTHPGVGAPAMPGSDRPVA